MSWTGSSALTRCTSSSWETRASPGLTGDGPGRVPNNRIPSLDEWKADLGVGADAGWIGVYLAKAVTDGEPVRFFIRLERRF